MSAESIKRIMNNNGMPYIGFCSLELLGSRLLDVKAKNRIPGDAKTVITTIFPYLLEDELYDKLNISRYAAMPDYHAVAGQMLKNAAISLQKLFPYEKFEPFIDNSPIPEVLAGVLAGLGVRGKNGLLITPDHGSYVFIGEIVTTWKIEAEEEYPANIPACLECGECAKKCPSGALTPGGLDKNLCLSNITQQKRELTPDETSLIKSSGCAWGCDICQTCCPMNQNAKTTYITEFINGARPHVLPGDDLSGRAYAWRGREVIGRNLRIIEG